MAVVSIGEAAARVVSHAGAMMAFRDLLRSCPTVENQRRFLAAAYANGAIREDEFHLLNREAV